MYSNILANPVCYFNTENLESCSLFSIRLKINALFRFKCRLRTSPGCVKYLGEKRHLNGILRKILVAKYLGK